MTNKLAETVNCPHRLSVLLLSYLDTAVPHWPGGDGLTLEDALSSYAAAAIAGQVPDRRQLCEQHPDLVGEVDAFFASLRAERLTL